MRISPYPRVMGRLSAATAAALLLSAVPGLGLVGNPPTAQAATTIQPIVVSFESGVSKSWTVPAGVTEISVSAIGGRGGDTNNIYNENRTLGARGGAVSGTLSVTPGQVIHVRVGGNGGLATIYDPSVVIAGGVNGGRPGTPDYYYPSSGSGGASDIRAGGTSLSHRILVAGGGGGNAGWLQGGAADAPGEIFDGSSSFMCANSTAADAGTPTSGGAGATATNCRGGSKLLPGQAGTFGHGGTPGGPTAADGSEFAAGAPGGGGYYGGGGGTSWAWTSGAGGSNYASPEVRNYLKGLAAQNAEPAVTISYVATISAIAFDPIAAAPADGRNVTVRFSVLGPEGPVANAVPTLSLTLGSLVSGPTHQGNGVYTAQVKAPLSPLAGTVTATALGVSGTAALTFTQRSQSITTAAPPSAPIYVNTSWDSQAAATSGLAVTGTHSGACVLGAGLVSFTQAGTCTLTFTQTGTTVWAPASPEVRTLTVVRRPQVITFAPNTSGQVGQTVALQAVGGGSGMPVAFAASGACSLESTTLRLTKAGDCVVTASQGGNDEYDAATPVAVTISASRNATSITLDAPAPITHGQDLLIAATVPGGVAGEVQFTVDGDATGSPVGVRNGGAEMRVGSLAAGAHRIGAVFTPADEVTYLPATATDVTATVAQAGTTSAVAVTARDLTATVTSNEPGAGHPTGSVTFLVDGAAVGTAALVDGVATLTHAVNADDRRSIAVTYAGDSNFLLSSGSTVRENPTITAALSPAPNRAGWHAKPVTVSFSCTPGSAPLAQPCPAPVTVRDATARSVAATILAADGGVATVAVAGINVDTVAPTVSIRGVQSGRGYTSKPTATCVGVDRGAGIASCTVTTKVKGSKIVAEAVATDHAGHRSRVTVTARLDRVQLRGLRKRNGAYPVRTGNASYTLVVHSAVRPRYLAAAKSPHKPTVRGRQFRKVGPKRWALAVRFEPKMRHTRNWNIGAQIGKQKVIIPIRVTR